MNRAFFVAAAASPSPDKVWEWIVIAALVAGAVAAIIKVMSWFDERYATRREMDALEAAWVRDNARNEKLLEKFEELIAALRSRK